MKRLAIIFFFGILLASCQKESPVVSAGSGKGSVILSLDTYTFSADTKSVASEAEKKINNLYIVIYDNKGKLEWSAEYQDFKTSRTIVGLEEGMKTVWIVANKKIVVPGTLAQMKAVSTTLRENNRKSFVMVGSADVMASTTPVDTKIDIRKVCAKVTLREAIETRWGNIAPGDFNIEKIYLANLDTLSNFSFEPSGVVDVNLRTTVETTDDSDIRSLTVIENDKSWVSGGLFNKGVDFYLYPNNNPDKPTALLIKASYDGRTCYYPIVFDKGIKSGTSYWIGLIEITCEGVATPEEAFSKIKACIGFNPSPWDDADMPKKNEF